MKRISRFAPLMALSLLTAALLVGCNQASDTPTPTEAPTVTPTEAPTEAATAACVVTVLDYKGQPMPDVVISVLKDGAEVKKNVSKADGTVSFSLEPGSYELAAVSTAGDFYYDKTAAVLNTEAAATTLTLYHKANDADAVTIWPAGGEKQALPVGEGASYVALDGGMTYVVFRPEREGLYEISYVADGNVDLGYYGSPVVVFEEKMLETIDGKVTLNVRSSSINTEGGSSALFVFGLEPDQVETRDCILTVTRIGDPEKTPIDEPWIEYNPTQAKPYEGTTQGAFKDIDVTDPTVKVVYSETDGFYHFGTADGPVVFIRITTDSPYLASLTTMAEKSRVGVYHYDGDGKFLSKESFHNMIAAYAEIVNGDGVCPLTPELEYMIKTVGTYRSWWDLSFEGNIFPDKIVTPETAWLFICGYYG